MNKRIKVLKDQERKVLMLVRETALKAKGSVDQLHSLQLRCQEAIQASGMKDGLLFTHQTEIQVVSASVHL